jgi:hypothetical protein
MSPFSRRRAITLVSSFVAAASLPGCAARAQSPSGSMVFDITNFLGPGVDTDAAFAKAGFPAVRENSWCGRTKRQTAPLAPHRWPRTPPERMVRANR